MSVKWTIQRQFLTPVLAIAVACFLLSSALAAWVATRWAQEREHEQLRRVVASITHGGFPLTPGVLRRMSDLSGAELIVMATDGQIVEGTIQLGDDDHRRLTTLPIVETFVGQSDSRLMLDGRSYAAARVALVSQSGADKPLTMTVLYPEDRWWAIRRELSLSLLAVGLVGLVVLGVTITLVARRVVQPIQRLHQGALMIAQGDFSPVPVPTRNDEVRDLAQAINEMVSRLAKYSLQVRQNERLRTLGQLGGGLAHHLRNAATGARIALDLHGRSCPLGPADESLDVAVRQLSLMESYLRRFLTFGQRPEVQPSCFELEPALADIVALVKPACEHAKIELAAIGPAESVQVQMDSKELEQLVLNLLWNAIDAIGQQPAALRRIELVTEPRADCTVRLSVRDSGPGPTADIQPRLFEPFATDKPTGTGLGLAVVHEIVRDCGGTVSWNRHDGFTCFVVELPIARIEDPHGATVGCG